MSTQLTPTESNIELVETFNDVVFKKHDFERLDDLVVAEFVQVESGEVTVEGIDGLASYFEDMLETYESPTMEILHLVADEDSVVYRFRMIGTLADDIVVDGTTMDVAGETIEWEGFVSLAIADDRIVEANLITDEAAVLRQLGLMPEIAI